MSTHISKSKAKLLRLMRKRHDLPLKSACKEADLGYEEVMRWARKDKLFSDALRAARFAYHITQLLESSDLLAAVNYDAKRLSHKDRARVKFNNINWQVSIPKLYPELYETVKPFLKQM
jgi:hypothetical protein